MKKLDIGFLLGAIGLIFIILGILFNVIWTFILGLIIFFIGCFIGCHNNPIPVDTGESEGDEV